MYIKPFKVRVGSTVINIESSDHVSGNNVANLKMCAKRFVLLKHFIDTCEVLLSKAKSEPVYTDLEKFVRTQMRFGKKIFTKLMCIGFENGRQFDKGFGLFTESAIADLHPNVHGTSMRLEEE